MYQKESFKVGDKVIAYIIDDCGICYDCKHNHENICESFTKSKAYYNPNGYSGFYGFSEYAVVKARNLYAYPKATPDEEAAFSEPLACVLNSIQRSHIRWAMMLLLSVAVLWGYCMFCVQNCREHVLS